jgi:hypothetical protein
MELYNPRKLKYKAWNSETKLLMRLNSIDCIKGELFKKGHILLQFTGLFDKHEEEIYDMDILLKDSDKYLIKWSAEQYGWAIVSLDGIRIQFDLKSFSENSVRLRSYFEAGS